MREVDAAWRVRTVSDALREASDLLGRSYLRLAAAVWPMAELVRTALRGAGPSWSGPRRRRLGCPPQELARLVAFDDVQTVMAAALKLEPFDPARA